MLMLCHDESHTVLVSSPLLRVCISWMGSQIYLRGREGIQLSMGWMMRGQEYGSDPTTTGVNIFYLDCIYFWYHDHAIHQQEYVTSWMLSSMLFLFYWPTLLPVTDLDLEYSALYGIYNTILMVSYLKTVPDPDC
jgi:hypothetical protein